MKLMKLMLSLQYVNDNEAFNRDEDGVIYVPHTLEYESVWKSHKLIL